MSIFSKLAVVVTWTSWLIGSKQRPVVYLATVSFVSKVTESRLIVLFTVLIMFVTRHSAGLPECIHSRRFHSSRVASIRTHIEAEAGLCRTSVGISLLPCFHTHTEHWGRSQWPRGLRHELSSPPQTLGSWVRIALKAWMSVCIYSVCVVMCVSIGFATG
jgi:hypothetical protein